MTMKWFNYFLITIIYLVLLSCSWFPSSETLLMDAPVEPVISESSQQNQPVPIYLETKPVHSAIQLKSLPEGWTVDHHPVAKWSMSLPTVMSNILDSAQSVDYWEEIVDLPTGYKLPLKRSKVFFEVITRLTIESIELHFVNVDHIYSSTNHEPSHYIMNGVIRKIELKPTEFPQLMAEDIVKYKFLMEYGTPSEYVGGFHHYENDKTVLKVREMDKSHVQIQMNSVLVDQKLRTAINDMYSEEGIEYQKKLLLRAIDF